MGNLREVARCSSQEKQAARCQCFHFDPLRFAWIKISLASLIINQFYLDYSRI